MVAVSRRTRHAIVHLVQAYRGSEVVKTRLVLGGAVAAAGIAGGWVAGAAFAGVATWASGLGKPTEAGLYLAVGFVCYRVFRLLWPGPE